MKRDRLLTTVQIHLVMQRFYEAEMDVMGVTETLDLQGCLAGIVSMLKML